MFLKTKRRHVRGCCSALALLIACTAPGSTFAQGAGAIAQLKSVFEDWQFRQGILKSARYVLTGTTEFKVKKLPPGSPNRPLRYVLILDPARKRYRLERSYEELYSIYENGEDEPTSREYRVRISTSTYDGEAMYKYSHRKANQMVADVPDLSIGKGNLGPGAFLGSELLPIFFAHGIVPTVHTPLVIDKLTFTHDPDDFYVVGQQLLRRQNCLVVRTERSGSMSDEFWINSRQKSAIHRHISFSAPFPWTRLDISWKNTAYGWWVDEWSETSYIGGRVSTINRLHVESFEANPDVADSDFKLPAEPGMKVSVCEGPPPGKGLDPFKGAVTTYVISPSGAWEEISAKGFTTLDGKELPPEGHPRWIAWTIGGGAVIGVLLFYALRRQRKRAAL
jgi:hypothetical protein